MKYKKSDNRFGIMALILSVIFAVMFFQLSSVTDIAENEPAASEIVSISNLDIKTKASLENKYDVTETFDVTFNESGLSEVVRFIPYAGYNYRSDGANVDKKLYIARIQNAKGNGWKDEEFHLYSNEQTGYLTFGLKCSTGYFTKGETRHYQISYTYDCGKDNNSGFDDLYFNIVGTASPMTITNITFSIELPKVAAENISVYYGKAGLTTTLTHSYDESNYIVSGTLDQLKPFEGITLRAVYKDGTFTAGANFSLHCLIALCVSLLAVAIALVYFFCFAQNRKLAVPVEVITPEGLNPYSADFFVNGTCGNKNLISYLIILANKGYVSLKKLENDDVEITALRTPISNEENYTTLKGVYDYFFEGKSSVKLSEFDDMPPLEMIEKASKARTICNDEEKKANEFLYDKRSQTVRKWLRIAAIVLCLGIGYCLIFAHQYFFGFASMTFWTGAAEIEAVLFLFSIIMCKKNMLPFKLVMYALLSAMVLWYYLVLGFSFIDGYFLFIVAFILLLPIGFLLSVECKYTKEGAVAKGRALGFKKYIEMCEVERLKMFAEENPNLFFDVLPYAYSFGLTDVWIKKFENIPLEIPEWVASGGGSIGDLVLLSVVLNDLDEKTSKIDNFARSSGTHLGGGGSSFDGGGFSGGGGSSGGGSGGGGFGAR